MVITDLCAALQQYDPPTSSSLLPRCELAAQQRKENPKRICSSELLTQHWFGMVSVCPVAFYDSMVYVTANGAHTDEWSAHNSSSKEQTHTHTHTLPLPARWGWAGWYLKSWRGRMRVRLEDQKGNCLSPCRNSAEQLPPYWSYAAFKGRTYCLQWF